MFFKKKSNILFRKYETFGYITDNRNFGYKQIDNNYKNIGDKIISESGAVFLSALTKVPQTIDVLVKKISEQFTDVDINILRNDAKEFYKTLEQEGFIISGKTIEECEMNDTRFSYKTFNPDIKNNNIFSSVSYPQKNTQDFLEEYFNGKPQLTNLHIEIISKCNERCIHCYIPHENKVSYIEPYLFYDILKQCKDLNLLHLTISGGEPMLHNNFCDFLRKAKEFDFSINVLSNLTLLNDDIIKEMKSNPLLGVQVSLYSMNSNIHDEITQMKGSYEKTKKAILQLIKNDIPLQISCPIIKQNKNCYKDVIKWAKMYKIQVGDDYGVIGRYNHTTENLSCRLSINEIKDIIDDKIACEPQYLEQLEREVEKKKNISINDFVCSVCHSSICIADNGNIYPCAGWQDYILGNVKESSLIDIWFNSKKAKYLRNLRKQNFSKCIQCTDKDFCTMCMVRNANENQFGDPLIVNQYFCEIAKLNKQKYIEYKEIYFRN
jgi:radical SAM protein with 4Fe4S-binding SPASM domain